MAVKKCTKCGVEKSLAEFSPNGNGYLKARCRPCKSADVCASYAKKTPEQKRAIMERIAAWVQKNPDKYRRYAKATRAAKPDHYRLKVQLRRSRHRGAIPIWADSRAIAEFYKMAAQRTKTTGIPHEVDHIVPLQSRFVCGLHWEGNLQVLPMIENKKKNNRYWPDMP